MSRNRTIPADFWTWEAVIDCKPMTRLLFIGLWNFADDFGVQPLRPRTIRMQVFPGDALDEQQMRAMIEELAARKLVRIYAIEGQEYLEIIDWQHIQRVGKRAKRRYPSPGERPASTTADHSKPLQTPAELPASTAAPDHSKPLQSPAPDPDLGAEKERAIGQWMADGCEAQRDVVPAVDGLCQVSLDSGPPSGLDELAAAVAENCARRAAAGPQVLAPAAAVG